MVVEVNSLLLFDLQTINEKRINYLKPKLEWNNKKISTVGKPSANCKKCCIRGKGKQFEKRFFSTFRNRYPLIIVDEKCSEMSSFEKTTWKTFLEWKWAKKKIKHILDCLLSTVGRSKLHLALMRKSEMYETMQYLCCKHSFFPLFSHFAYPAEHSFSAHWENSNSTLANFTVYSEIVFTIINIPLTERDQFLLATGITQKFILWEISIRWANERKEFLQLNCCRHRNSCVNNIFFEMSSHQRYPKQIYYVGEV